MTEYVRTLDPETMTDVERLALAMLRAVYASVESSGGCFDVLVRAAIEAEET